MFQTKKAVEKEFTDWDDLFSWVSNENKSTSRISIHGLLKNDARFQEDDFFGTSDFKLRFTNEGLRALCYKIGFPQVALEMPEEIGLSSRILNDLIKQDRVKKAFAGTEFVVNENVNDDSFGHVCGIVSDSYVGYSNYSFLNDIEKVIDGNDLSPIGDLLLKEAYSINTKLHLRLTSTKVAGIVSNRGNIAEDKTEIGLEFCNSMVGDAAISIDYFLYRLVCSNGLVLPAVANRSRVIHSGKSASFAIRLNRAFTEALSALEEKSTYVNQLCEIEFLPKRLVELGLNKMIFDIIPKSKSKSTVINCYSCFNDYLFRKLSLEEKRMREELAIKYLPLCYAREFSKVVFNSSFRDNASMFDLINVFTEYAKETPPAERVEIQKRAGQLTEWVVQNKKKFN